MGKIAAAIVPASRAGELPGMAQRMAEVLSLFPHQHVESVVRTGTHSACLLLRVGPDPLNPNGQPVTVSSAIGVACGYYVNACEREQCGDSGSRLLEDVAVNAPHRQQSDGVYAYALWRPQQEVLCAGVDKLGMRPLFWSALPGGGFALASEIKALVVLQKELRINWAAWEEQMRFGFLFGNHTYFHGIERAAPAEEFHFTSSDCRRRQTEDFLSSIDIRERSTESYMDEQHEVFDSTMKKLSGLYDARSDTMLTLSGGFDSRRVLAWLLQRSIPLQAYTVPDVEADGREFESAAVKALRRHCDFTMNSIYPRTVTERTEVTRVRDIAMDLEADEHNYAVMLTLGSGAFGKVNYDGLGAGSQLSGAFASQEYFAPGGDELFLRRSGRPVDDWLRLPDSSPPLEQRLRAELARFDGHPNRFAWFYFLSRTRREVGLAPLSVQANVFESLYPYLDRDMMRCALSFPPAAKIGADMQRRHIAAIDPMLARLPFAADRSVAEPAQYVRRMQRIERGAARERLRVAARPLRGHDWRIPAGQQGRLYLLRLMAAWLPVRRRAWEQGKADRLFHLRHFCEISVSPEHYRGAIQRARPLFRDREHWRSEL